MFVFHFGNGSADGDASQRVLLGGKGAGLAEMARLKIPVPPGFTIPTTVCQYYHTHSTQFPKDLDRDVRAAMTQLESVLGRRFGGDQNPLLVSVRSGAAQSMPGMMETILNLGLTPRSVEGLAQRTGNPRFAYDSYRRFIQMYSDVVLEVEHKHFEEILMAQKKIRGVTQDVELTAEDLKSVALRSLAFVEEATKGAFPNDPEEQLWGAIRAVFRSWNSKRAIEYRRIYGIPDDGGTAVNVQAMVFGNTGDRSGTGVAFTRNPSTGVHEFFGEFLVNAQGEDVVAGIRTPQPIAEMQRVMPKAYAELLDITERLEHRFHDMQDIEFTVEDDKLWMLQTRAGKRTARAAVRLAVEMHREGVLTQDEAVLRVQPEQIDQLLHPMIDPAARKTLLGRGLAASPGAAVGQVVFDADDAVHWTHDGKKVILVRMETSPDDIQGMHVAEGFLTSRGGMTSHAAVVARGMGKPCVVGCQQVTVDAILKIAKFQNGQSVSEGDWVTIDGTTGEVMWGQMPLLTPEPEAEFATLMQWADKARRLKVRANADTPEDAALARKLGAEGIGLCRTEHMFFGDGRLDLVRQMIVAPTAEARQKALDQLLPVQRSDFEGIFRVMNGLPVTIRLLDPPLHEFLPTEPEQRERLSEDLGVPVAHVEEALLALHEMNPMLGHRGCRLAVTYPEILEMQVRAIMMAACHVTKAEKVVVHPEIELPLIAHVRELEVLRARVVAVCERVLREQNIKIEYKIGTMIELPRAAITADKLAKFADFFSFGTNDLTQTTYGLSRDDAGKFLPQYLEQKILMRDPFVTIDEDGVGALMQMATEKGRHVKPGMEVGICGEHGGDPASIAFCEQLGLDYVSCSPYRIPVARLAAAHATLKQS